MALPLEPQTSREVWVETVEQVINCLPKSFLALDDNTKRGKFRLGFALKCHFDILFVVSPV